MYWINSGTFAVSEVRDAFGVELDVINVKEFNAGKGRDYDYWNSIVHPETGERLAATQGYMDRHSNKCYYAEYRSESGKYYNYTLGINGESILSQQRKDSEARSESIKYAEARKNFSNLMNGEGTSERSSQLSIHNETNKNNDRF